MGYIKMTSIKVADLKFADLNIGDTSNFSKIISKEDVINFSKITGDFNPLHLDNEFAKKTSFKKNIIHGMLAGSLFSTLVGIYLPGKYSLYLSQTLKFKLPIYPGDPVLVRGTIISKGDGINLITLKTEILKEGKVAIDGEAIVKLLK